MLGSRDLWELKLSGTAVILEEMIRDCRHVKRVARVWGHSTGDSQGLEIDVPLQIYWCQVSYFSYQYPKIKIYI